MDWMTWMTNNHDSLRYNWSNPILRNVLDSLNNSLYGPRFIKHIEDLDEVTPFEIITQAAQYGTVTALILIFVAEIFIFKKEGQSEKNNFILQWPLNTKLSTLVAFLIFLIISPVILVTLSGCLIYKFVVALILRIKLKNQFISMMDGIDAVWAIEEDNATSVINVIATVDLTMEADRTKFLENLKSEVHSKLFKAPSTCMKMLYRRSFCLGYYYWMSNPEIDIKHYVKMVDFSAENKSHITREDVEEFVSRVSNSKLPYDNTATWEILVSDKPTGITNSFPILFRIHHSLGDGVALLKLLLNTIGCNKEKRWKMKSLDEDDDFFKTLTFLTDLFNVGQAAQFIKAKIMQIVNGVIMCLIIPKTLLNQLLRPPDENILHGPLLNGNKITVWMSEDECNSSGLLVKIKQLKKRIPGVTFSELILTALSESFQKYFLMREQSVPTYVTSVVPVRMNPSDLYTMEYKKNNFVLENKFSVAMLTIPLTCDANENASSALKRLIQVRKETDVLRKSADFYVNYGLMKMSGFTLPTAILRPMMDSVQATLVISNLPGPSDVNICGKYRLEKMAFFVPNRGTTGIGLTILSCDDKLQFGMIVDEILINSRKDAKSILEGIVEGLENLDKITSKTAKAQQNVW